MTDSELEQQLGQLVRQERTISRHILELINLAESRKLPLLRGYPSTLEWLVKKYGYSERAAYRRVSAARLLKAVPEAGEKLEAGEVSLTTLAQVQSAAKVQERATGEKVSASNKAEIVHQIQNLTSAETERELMSFFPAMASEVRRDKVSAIDQRTSRLAVNLENETLEKLRRAKELLSHVLPEGEMGDVIDRIADEFLDRNDPLKKQCQNESAEPAQSLGVALRRRVLREARGACEYHDPETGNICGSHHQIEIDHIRPKAMGGGNERENLRVLCRQHNQLMAEKNLGHVKANQWRNHS